MSDRIKDRVLILRIKPEHLQTTLREKMKSISRSSSSSKQKGSSSAGNSGMDILDLPDVKCAASADNSTLWYFTCDNKEYPARLTNLPLPVELHKTVDHAKYFKSTDVGQMLIVYEDMKTMDAEEGTANYSHDAYHSYYHSGLTPPMKYVVHRRFAAREHSAKAPPKHEVADVENYIKGIIVSSTRDGTKKSKKSSQESKVIKEIEDDIVDYEPWMENGIEFSETDAICKDHPEVWLPPAPRGSFDPPSKAKTSRKKDKGKSEKKGSKLDKSSKPRVNLAKATQDEIDPAFSAAMEIANADAGDVMEIGDMGFDFDLENLDFEGM
mmetsp:Transcript_22908/g.34390  ORF Transcript_22908/g.34390 Transcript_22908/m.34390 type:complete len:325 (-) Transcript_22908:620-1594(-)|eukprot:CAMPEP_0116030628 /NCGR_PEP_ID=MMETSP0321-20121206/16974_1 /TAXON_ID=163516 /ORGANISM="Leptocylindrus danicus var. danicus, Strain B650" /LENGTH=324 /DNA_ID=CAMNT_0003505483 /DNA_START=77 /DNA_END=1054 /DNA_ORIENTATION=+